MTADAAAQGRGNGRRNPSPWRDDFTRLDSSRWAVVNDYAPGYIANNHIGFSLPENVDFRDGHLVLKLTQANGAVGSNSSGVISRGGAVYTKEKYGYGTYEWQMRMSSSATTPTGTGQQISGSVSAGFIYVNNSETEIDFEAAGHAPGDLFTTTWNNKTPGTGPDAGDATSTFASVSGLATTSMNYKFIWERGRVRFYVNDTMVAEHTTNVPTAAAHFMINHWGTNSPYWGGTATLGSTRYFYIDWVRYTPQ